MTASAPDATAPPAGMRIMLITSMLPGRRGDGAIPLLLYAQITGLLERGHRLTLVTTAGDEPGVSAAVEDLADVRLDLRVVDRRQPPPGLRRWRRRLRLASSWTWRGWPWRTVWFADPAVQGVIDELVGTEEFDVVAVEDNPMSVFRFPEGLPSVLTEHEVRRPRPVDWHPGPLSRWPAWVVGEIDWRRWPGFQRRVWAKFDLIQVFSSRDAAAIAEIAPTVAANVRVNPFGIMAPSLLDPSRESPGTVLFVGNFTHPPNRDAAIWLAREIMPAVRARYEQARLRIVGSEPSREVLDLVGPGVDVVADAPSIAPHLEEAAVVLAPVRIGGGMRMKVLEALSNGKPVVTTPRGAEGFVDLDPEPPMVIAEDTEEIAAATAALLADGRRRHELGERARTFTERNLHPGPWAGRLEAVYNEARAASRDGGDP